MEMISREDALFLIRKEDMQNEALEKLGRCLTEEELDLAKKGLESGLMSSIDIVYNTILFEMIKK